MRAYIGSHHAASVDEFVELALGTPIELWLGVEGESEEEAAAREAAARDILADDPSLADRVSRVAAQAVDAHPEVFNVAPLVRPAAKPRRRPMRKAVAA
ncbi:hypothetical protein [Streptomyces sp. NPDC058657]|uniref:hypothetical protein n=1 Tax=unclassified Streptomyces TaxID=2593676 RepID=UPI00364C0EEA